ncbi:complex I subunit 1 family protein [Haloferula sargassicola]|uniref:NADH-quinone oxidoreductase subunit H n=1 Tax=Haloferula sargassicola TaxID=490096 RepID=A0ABP9UNG3_9BACT
MSWLVVIVLYPAGLYLLAVVEHWSSTGFWVWGRPCALAAQGLLQESVRPKQRDKVFYESAPLLLLGTAVLALAVLPFGAGLIAAPLATGALFLNAALAYVMVALLMAGWAPNGVYAMIGGWRFLGQLIAYSMPIVMAITAVVMRAESMALDRIVGSQATLWNLIYQPVGFVLFYLAALALAFLPPFDIPQARGELAGGVFAEYTGWRWLQIRLARMVLVLALSLAVAVFFLGGSGGPWLPGLAWTFLKTMAVAVSFFLCGRLLPRVRHDHTLEWSWKFATPAALFNILWVGILLLL